MKKYNSMTEIIQDTSLNLLELDEAIWAFLDERNMSMPDFMATEEGQKIMAEQREKDAQFL